LSCAGREEQQGQDGSNHNEMVKKLFHRKSPLGIDGHLDNFVNLFSKFAVQGGVVVYGLIFA
jgi:hypothetical protein